MRIYIAGTYEARERLRPIAQRVKALGHIVTSSWLDETAERDEPEPDELLEIALRDLNELETSELIIVDLLDVEGPGRGGKHFETGFAFAIGVPLWIVGTPQSVFHMLVEQRFTHWDAALTWLEKEEESDAA